MFISYDSECLNGIFKCSKHHCLIDTHLLERINNDESLSWKAENYSDFYGKTLDQGYKHKLGVKLSYKRQRDIYFEEDNDSLPDFDFRTKEYFSGKIKNQENCGASWAYSMAGIILNFFVINLLKFKTETSNN